MTLERDQRTATFELLAEHFYTTFPKHDGVGLDMLGGADTERARLEMVRRRPLPFPPEPARWAAISLTQRALERGGPRGPWLGALDRLAVGFES